jgi:hypothetical protein
MMLAAVNCSQTVTLAGPARPRTGRETRELSRVEDGAAAVYIAEAKVYPAQDSSRALRDRRRLRAAT